MAEQRDFYEVLGVERGAVDAQIKDAYRKLAMMYHPDRNPGDADASDRFKEAARAFEVLSDQALRTRYDRYGHAGIQGGGAHDFGNVSDIFEAFGGIFGGSIFGDAFGNAQNRTARGRKGRDVFCTISLTLLEAARGVVKSIEFTRHEACGECNGTGARKGTKPQRCDYCEGRGQVIQSAGPFRLQATCPACSGTGKIVRDKCSACSGDGVKLERVEKRVTIPAGVDRDVQVRLAGEGEPGGNGGTPGDCYCVIGVEEHPFLTRSGRDLSCQVPITISQAALGAIVEVPILDGTHAVEMPRGTQPGDVLRLRGFGMPEVRGRGIGDLLVQVHVEIPRKLSPRAEQLLRDLAEEEHALVSPAHKSFFVKMKEYFTSHQSAEEKE